mmetsp:Transcript_22583/g.55873  ORF Transcript_22583/g.55873 Transcript_22583/m.55873 type:complete len:191 (+) Transcript_22583:64-636(+)|eukprot:CAMPEP_0113628728 /NCGR_PEP_ID=MMETSP0017_2-20120614/14891_1 /TAXON_ID=2856 /ORGANISM="Cylindrotheca closterium" /LENGTH=190 /DNA_ID=CAMNT_0000539055 /DNA_START=39 /DNA_END=611 /DNA_ORIENTATION=+ /assembly_acc=CAM_ASM_000147
MKSFYLLVLLEVGATASTFPGNDVSFGVRRQPSFLKRRNNNSKPSDSQSTLSSALSIRGGAFDPYIGDIYYSEVSPESSKSEQDSYDTTYPNDNNDSPIVSSSQVLYEGGCFVSSDSMERPLESMFNNFFNGFGDSDDEEDDDDDDNDGHSSMLANGSLTRSRREESTGRSYSYGNQMNSVYLESEVQFQ